MPTEEILAPPSWESVETDEAFQKLTPEDKAITLGNWAKATRAYGDSVGAWEDPELQKQFQESARAKLQEYQSQFAPTPQGSLLDRVNLGVQEFAPRAMGAADQLLSLATRFPEVVIPMMDPDPVRAQRLVEQYQDFNKLGQGLNEMAQAEQAKAREISEAGRALGGGPNIPVLGNVGDLVQEGIPATLQAAMDIGLSGGAGTARSLQAPAVTALESVMRNATAPAIRQATAVAGGQQTLSTMNQEIAQRVEAGETPEEAQVNALPKALSSGLITALTTSFGGFTGAESVLKASGVSGLKNRIVEVLKESGMEAAEETLDQAGNQIAGWLNDEFDPSKPKEGTWQQRLQKAVNLNDLAKSGFLGGVIGGNLTAIGQAAEAIRDRTIVQQSAVQSENLIKNSSPATAQAVEEIAATEVADSKIESQRKSASIIDDLLATPASQLSQPTVEPSASPESQFAPTPAVTPAVETEAAAEQPFSTAPSVQEVTRPSKMAAPATLPPVQPGFVRFYHGGNSERGGGGRWVSPDYSYAKGYADRLPNGVVQYVDIPKSSSLLKKSYDDSGGVIPSPYIAFEAPEEIMAQAVIVPAQEIPEQPPVVVNETPVGDTQTDLPVESEQQVIAEEPPAAPETVIPAEDNLAGSEGTVLEGGGAEQDVVQRDQSKPEQMTPEEFISSRRDDSFGPARWQQEDVDSRVRLGEITEQQGKDEIEAIYQAEGQRTHSQNIEIEVSRNRPVSAVAIDSYGIKLPEGYIRQGDLYVYKPNENPPIQQDQPNVPEGVGEVPVGEQAAVEPVPRRIQLRGNPQSFSVVRAIPQTPQEQELGENYFEVRNERTGEVQTIESRDIAREIRPKSERVKKAIKKLPAKQQAKAEAATEVSTEADPYQGVPLTNAAPLPGINIPLFNELSELGVFDEDATAATVLKNISESKSTPDWARTLSNRLLTLGTAMDIQAVNRPDSTWSALYDGQGPTTYINLARRNPGAALSILHEASHSVTLDQIRNPDKLTGEVRKAYEDLVAIHQEVSALPEFQGEYGISNVEEMVAEAFSNAGFRKKLDRLQPNQKQTFWQRLVNAIARLLFNKPAAPTSLLHRAIEDAFTLAGAPIIESPSQSAPRREATKTETPQFQNWFKDSKVVDENGNPKVVYHGTGGDISEFSKDKRGQVTGAPSARRGFFFTDSTEVANNYARLAQNFDDYETVFETDNDFTIEELKAGLSRIEAPSSQFSNFINPFTGEKEMFPIGNVANARAIKDVVKAMEGGLSYPDAVKRAGVKGLLPGNLLFIDKGSKENVMPVYLSIQNPLVFDFEGKAYREQTYNSLLAQAQKEGRDGAIFRNTFDDPYTNAEEGTPHDIFVAFEPTQIKSAIGNSGAYDPTNANIAAMAESGSWPETLANPNASEAAETKALVEATQEFDNATEVEVTESLSPERRALIDYRPATDTEKEFNPIAIANFWSDQFRNIPGTISSDRQGVAIDGLVKAARQYDFASGVPFFSYASTVIRNHMRDYAKSRKVRSKYVTPDQPVYDEEETETIVSTAPSPQETTIAENDRKRMLGAARDALQAVMNKASERDREILKDYASAMSLREIAEEHGLSQEGVRKIIKRYRESVEKALFLRGINDVAEILTPIEQQTEPAVPTKAKIPYDEESYREVAGSIEEKEIASRSAILGEEDQSLSSFEEGFDGVPVSGDSSVRGRTGSYAQIGTYQSSPLEQALRPLVKERPELSSLVSRLSPILSSLGIETVLWEGPRQEAAILGNGKTIIKINPSRLNLETPEYIERVLEEEGIHALDLQSQWEQFRQEGLHPLQFQLWQGMKSEEMYNDLVNELPNIPMSDQLEVMEAITAAYNSYHLGNPTVAREPGAVEVIMRLNENAGANNRLPEGAPRLMDINQFLHEFARQIVQMRRNGRITEETSSTFLRKVADWLKQGINAIKKAAGIITEGGLSNTKFGKFTNDLLELANNKIPKDGLSRIAPMAERAIPESTNGMVAPMAERPSPGAMDKIREALNHISREYIPPATKPGESYEINPTAQTVWSAILDKGQLPASLKEVYDRLSNRINAVRGKVKLYTGDVKHAVEVLHRDKDAREAEYGRIQKALTQEDGMQISDLDESLQPHVWRVRNMVDTLSQAAIDYGIVEGELADTFRNGIGSYLRRGYAVFDPESGWTYKYLSKRKPEILQNARIYLKQKNPEAAPDQIETTIKELLDRDSAAGFILGGKKVLGKSVGSLMERKDISKPIRELLGEIKDPLVNLVRSGDFLGQLIAREEMQQEFRKVVLESNWAKTQKDSTFHTPLVEDAYIQTQDNDGNPIFRVRSNRRYDVLRGLYTTPEFKNAFDMAEQSGTGGDAKRVADFLVRGFLTASATAKTFATVLNPDSYAPNYIGAMMVEIANGRWKPETWRDAWSALRSGKNADVVISAAKKAGIQDGRHLYNELLRNGIFDQNITFRDFEATLKNSFLKKAAGTKPLEAVGKIYSAGDNLGKANAFVDEITTLKRAYPEMPFRQLVEQAAEIVTNTTPTYSTVPKAFRDISQLGFGLQNFFNFVYSINRVAGYTALQGYREIRSGNPVLVNRGYRRILGLTMVVSAASYWGAAMLSRMVEDLDDEEDQAFRRSFAAPWDRDANLLYTNVKDGKFTYSNTSYLNPFALVAETVTAVAQGKSPEQAAGGALRTVMGNFFSEGILLSAVLDVLRNRQKGTTREVYNEELDAMAKGIQMGQYVFKKALTPKAITKAVRTYKGATGQQGDYGKVYSPYDEAVRLMGYRANTVDVVKQLPYRLYDLNNRFKNAERILRSAENRKVPKGELDQARVQSEEAKRRVIEEYQQLYRDSLLLGITKPQFRKAMSETDTQKEVRQQIR